MVGGTTPSQHLSPATCVCFRDPPPPHESTLIVACGFLLLVVAIVGSSPPVHRLSLSRRIECPDKLPSPLSTPLSVCFCSGPFFVFVCVHCCSVGSVA